MAKKQFSRKSAKAATRPTRLSADEVLALGRQADEAARAWIHKHAPEHVHTAVVFGDVVRELAVTGDESTATRETLERSALELLPQVNQALNALAGSEAGSSAGTINPSAIFASLSSLDTDTLKDIQHEIGKLLVARTPAPKQLDSGAIVDGVSEVRMSFLYNSFYTFTQPTSLEETRPRNCLDDIKRDLHRLSPREVIGLALYIGEAVRVPISDKYTAYVERRAERSRQWHAAEKAKHEQRAAKKAQRGGRR